LRFAGLYDSSAAGFIKFDKKLVFMIQAAK
jgi:hypothetical protein